MSSTPRRLFHAAVLLLVFAASTVTRADPDLWGHLRFGLDTLHSRHLTSTDPYSFTQDLPWINHEWLSETQMAVAYEVAGAAGLSLLKGALAMGTLLLVWSSLSAARVVARVLTCLLLVMGTLHMWATIRPQLWSLVCFALLCRTLVRDRRPEIWRMPLIFAVWANCHGGWIVGLGVLAAWSVGSILRQPRDASRWVALTFTCALATLANPYGWTLWLFMARTVRMTRSIAEWGPLWGTPLLNWVPWILASGAALYGLWPPTLARLATNARVFLALGMLAVASARVMRIESLFICASAIMLAPWIAAAWNPRRLKFVIPPSVVRPAFLLGSTIAVALALTVGLRSLSCLRIFGDWAPDREAATRLAAAESGRLVTFFDWGEYALWHFGPRLKVSMDGRRETIYSEARLVEHDAILAGLPSGLDALTKWHAEYVWLPARSAATKQWLASHGDRIEVDGDRSFLAVRSDLPRLPTQVSARRADCFPE